MPINIGYSHMRTGSRVMWVHQGAHTDGTLILRWGLKAGCRVGHTWAGTVLSVRQPGTEYISVSEGNSDHTADCVFYAQPRDFLDWIYFLY